MDPDLSPSQASRRGSAASLDVTLDAWREAILGADALERAYLFVHLLQDARLLRRSAEAALAGGAWATAFEPASAGQPDGKGAAGFAGEPLPWWGGLLPQGRRERALDRAFAEHRFWRRFGCALPVPDLPSELLARVRTGPGGGKASGRVLRRSERLGPSRKGASAASPGDGRADRSSGTAAALAWARAAALLREGPDGHATLALAELAAGHWDVAVQRLAALEARNWRAAAEEPERVAACLFLGRALVAEKRGDWMGMRRELLAVAPLERCSSGLLATLYTLHLAAGDDDGVAAVAREWLCRPRYLGAGVDPAWEPLKGPLGRWARAFDSQARLRTNYAMERGAGALGLLARLLADAWGQA